MMSTSFLPLLSAKAPPEHCSELVGLRPQRKRAGRNLNHQVPALLSSILLLSFSLYWGSTCPFSFLLPFVFTLCFAACPFLPRDEMGLPTPFEGVLGAAAWDAMHAAGGGEKVAEPPAEPSTARGPAPEPAASLPAAPVSRWDANDAVTETGVHESEGQPLRRATAGLTIVGGPRLARRGHCSAS